MELIKFVYGGGKNQKINKEQLALELGKEIIDPIILAYPEWEVISELR
jgi:hypothetical protein